MYSLAICFYMLCVRIAALFNEKARLMTAGQRNTWRVLDRLGGKERYVWFHAASLGEFEQGRPLMERLRREHPEKKILLTFFSPSGYEVRKNYGGADVVCYLPFDTPRNARRFVRMARPEAVFFIKYEFWRNYIEALARSGVPVYSVSSIFRDDQIFFRRYGRGYARVLHRFTHLFVQNEHSRELLASLGVTNVSIIGDTRFDRVIDVRAAAKPLPLVERFAAGARLLVAGSTWPADEDIILPYFNSHPDVKLVLAPHVVDEAASTATARWPTWAEASAPASTTCPRPPSMAYPSSSGPTTTSFARRATCWPTAAAARCRTQPPSARSWTRS